MALPIRHSFGSAADLAAAPITPGMLYFLIDTGAIYFDTEDNQRIQIANTSGSGGGGGSGDVDAVLTPTGTNAVQGKAIYAAIQAVKDTINNMDAAQVGGTGKYIESIKQVNGVITANVKDFANATTTADGLMSKQDKAAINKIPATGDIATKEYVDTEDAKKVDIDQGVANKGKVLIVGDNGKITVGTATGDSYTKTETDAKIDEKINALDVANVGGTGKYIESISQTDGKITAVAKDMVEYEKATSSADGLMSKEDKSRIDAMENGAQKNVQSDWNATNTAADNFIKNKPTLGEAAAKSVSDILDEIDDDLVIAKLGYTPVDESDIGANGGIAPLGSDGKIPESYLPSYISQIVSYAERSSFPTTGDDNTLYYDSSTNSTYRWNGTTYVQVSSGLALGETASTAYAGNKGKIAYDHAMKKGSQFGEGATKNTAGFYKFVTNAQGHVTNAVPVTAADINALGISGGGGDGATYTAGTGINITGTVISNSGVTAVAQGSADGTVSVTTNGSTSNVAVNGLKTAAFADTTNTLVGTDTQKVLTGKAVADYVDDKLDEIKPYTLDKTDVNNLQTKISLKQDNVEKASVTITQAQANWNETDSTKSAFIMNKPEVYTKTEVDAKIADVEVTVDAALSATSTNPVQNKAVKTALDGKVDAQTGKGLSTNDYTTAEKTKLAGVAEGAEANVDAFGKVLVNGVTVAAGADGDTFTLAEGSNITLLANAATKTITISSSGGGGEGGDYDDTALKARITTLETNTANMYTKTQADALLNNKVDKVAGKDLSTNDYATADKNKLAGIEEGANKTTVDAALSATSTNPVQNKAVKTALDAKQDKATTISGYGITDAYTKTEIDTTLADYRKIDDEPEYGLTKSVDNKKINLTKDGVIVATVTDQFGEQGADPITYVLTKNGDKLVLTPSTGTVQNVDLDVYTLGLNASTGALEFKKNNTVAATLNNVTGVKGNSETVYRRGEVNITAANIGLDKVDNLSAAEIRDAMTKAEVVKALDYTPEDVAKKGVANGYAELGSNGKVPASQLPSYLSEIKSFASRSAFPAAGDSSIIYVAEDTLVQYRWSGTAYVAISGGAGGSDLELGETSSTAYRGDRGKTAYDHASDANKATTAKSIGLYKIATTAEGHIANTDAVTKNDILDLGIGNDIGDLTTLTTTAKTSLVSAINEVASNSGGSYTAGDGIKIQNGVISINLQWAEDNSF